MNNSLKKVIFGSVLGISLIWIIYHINHFEVKSSDLKLVVGVLSKDPEFIKGRGSSRYLELVINDDKKRYLIGGTAYEVLDTASIRKNLKEKDSISILVAREKGVNEFLDRLVGVVDIYGLESSGTTYITLQEYNESIKGNRFSIIILWFVFVLIYFYKFWIKKA